jgi:predicted dienelactone hydrolase
MSRAPACWLLLFFTAGCGGGAGNGDRFWPPGRFGPYEVGLRQMEFYDESRGRKLPTAVWYPAVLPIDGVPVKYLGILEGQAVADAPPLVRDAPYPLVLFSHGNKGIGVQSFTFCEHLASQGLVVAAPDHPGNTLVDNPDDEEMARSALERPPDIVFVMERLLAGSAGEDAFLEGLLDSVNLAVAGHSFGGYTALVLAGARASREEALERCRTTHPEDVMCPYVGYWPPGYIQTRPDRASLFKAAVALAPGGYGAFGDSGLSSVDMPVFLAGGDLDQFTAADLRPIYRALGPPRAKLEIAGVGHLSFSDICRANLPVPELQELCDPEKFLPPDRVFAIVDAYATLFLRVFLHGERELIRAADGLAKDFSEAAFEAEWK